MSRRFGPRGGRGRLSSSVATGYVAPTTPVSAKAGVFYWGADLSDPATWAPRVDNVGAGSLTGVATTIENTTQGAYPSMRMVPANSAYLRNDYFAAQLIAANPVFEIVMWIETIVLGASCTFFSASTSSGTTFKRVLAYTTGAYRFTQQATLAGPFVHNAKNTNLQMVRIRGRADGSITLWRNEEPDPINGFWGNGTAATAIGAQTGMDRFLIGAQWNGGSGPVNFNDQRVVGFLWRNPAAAEYTDDEGIQIHNWGLGALANPPLYNDAVTQYALLMPFGQSNEPGQGLGTGAVAGMPDATAKMFIRALNNDADDPTAISALDRRPGASSYSSSMQWIPTGSFAMQHHFCGVGMGATNIGSNWEGQNGAGPVNSLGGYMVTGLYSECRRNIMLSKARFGGNPIVQIIWQQGENDAAAGAAVAAAYASNFANPVSYTNVLGYLRKIIARVWGLADVPCHAVQLNPNQTGGGIVTVDLNTIRAGMVTLAGTVTALRLVETNDITNLSVDNLHYKNASDSYGLIGTRLITSVKASDARL